MGNPAGAPARRASVGQPMGQPVDRDFVLARMAALQLDRREMVKRAGNLISPRTLQRVVNAPGARLSLTSAAALAAVLECGSRDPLIPSAPLAERIASFGLSPHPPFPDSFGAGPGRRPWVARAEEAVIEAGLAGRRPVVVHAAERGGKTSLARRIADRLGDRYPRGVLWLDGEQDPDRARAAVAECLGLFHPFPMGDTLPRVLDERFARVLWARPRLLIVDGARDGAQVLRLLGRYRGPMDLLVLTDREEAVLALERHLGQPAVSLAPLSRAQVIAALLARHPGDERLLGGAERRRGRARSERRARGAGPRPTGDAKLRALADLEDSVPGWRALLDAIAGRPDAMDFASDQLRLTRLATLDEIALRVGRSASVNSPLLARLTPAARRFFLRLGALDGVPAPLDWAAAAAGVAVDEARSLCDELALLLQHHQGAPTPGVSISPHLRQFAASALPPDERAAAEHRLLHRAREEALRLERLPPREAMGALRAVEPLLLSVLGRIRPADGPEHATRARLALEILLPLRHLLPAWRADALEPALAAALSTPGEGDLLAEAHQLRVAQGRWLMTARADHGGAEVVFRTAAEGFARLGRPLEAADARIEQGIALFSTMRGAQALPIFREAAELARLGQAPVDVLARQLVNVAFAETRRRAGADHRAGWRKALALLDEAARLLRRAGAADAPLARIVEVNRAIAGRVLERSGWRLALAGALGALLELTSPDDLFRAYLLATATGADLVIERSRAAQRRRIRELWWAALALRGFAVGDALRRLGQMAYFLNAGRPGGAPSGGDVQLVSEGTAVTDPPLPLVARYGASIATLFLVEPMREVYDGAFIDAIERFVWELGGPNQARVIDELERLRAGPGRSPARPRAGRGA